MGLCGGSVVVGIEDILNEDQGWEEEGELYNTSTLQKPASTFYLLGTR